MARGKTSRHGKSIKGANQKVSDDFLTLNAGKPGVVTTGSGLQYLILDEGEGIGPTPDDFSTVTVHQRVSLVDKTVITDTYPSNTPESFTMDEAIDGYKEGLSLMKAGDRYRFFIPSDLAWGNRGSGNTIGPYMIIIIDCRLVSIS